MLESILTFIAGVGIFLFSVRFLSKSIETLCGNRIRQSFSKISGNRFKNLGLGFVICFFLQSTTASVLMTVGFCGMGAISLFQGVCIIIGANLASGLTPFLISFSSFNLISFFCALAGVGAFMQIFSKKTIVKQVANVIIAFSLFFVSIQLIGNATDFLKTNEVFMGFFSTLENPILLILFGFAFTILIQSSLGTMAILMTLLGTSVAPGIISFSSAIYAYMGAVAGSSLTSFFFGLISSTNEDSRRLSLFHFILNLTGVIVFSLLTITDWWRILSFLNEPAVMLASVSFLFNTFDATFYTIFAKPATFILRKITFVKNHKKKSQFDLEYVEGEPKAVTMAKLNEKTILFFKELKKLFSASIEFVSQNNEDKALKKTISKFIENTKNLESIAVKLPSNEGNIKENEYVEKILITIKQVERDATNVVKMIDVVYDEDGNKLNYSSKLSKYILTLGEKIDNMFKLCYPYIENPDCDFSVKEKPNFEDILNLNDEVKNTISNAKNYIMKNGFNSQLSIYKNTRYLSVLNYISIISNNVMDNAFVFESDWQVKHKEDYKQLEIGDIEKQNKNEESA